MSRKEPPKAHTRGLQGRRREAGQQLQWRENLARMLLPEGCDPLSRLGWYPRTPPPLDPTETSRVLGRHPTHQAGCRVTSRARRRVGIRLRQGYQGRTRLRGSAGSDLPDRASTLGPQAQSPRPPDSAASKGRRVQDNSWPQTAQLRISRHITYTESYLSLHRQPHRAPSQSLVPAPASPLVGSRRRAPTAPSWRTEAAAARRSAERLRQQPDCRAQRNGQTSRPSLVSRGAPAGGGAVAADGPGVLGTALRSRATHAPSHRPQARPAARRRGGPDPGPAGSGCARVYRAVADDDDEDGGAPERRLGRADLVMSFVNMVERDPALGHQEPHWKEFRFDLTQIPAGEAVTAAEFRIYKLPSTHPLNQTLHISMFEVVPEQSNRESDLFFLDLQTLRSGDEGWLVLDVTAASDRWLLSRNKDLGLRLYVETDDGRSVDPGLAGLLGRQAPRSKQPFVVTFFRASPGPGPARARRAVRPLKRRPPKRTNELPPPNKLPGIFGEPGDGSGDRGGDGAPLASARSGRRAGRARGWDSPSPTTPQDWVIAPQGYSAYYCEGECSFPLDSCMNATNHAILQSLVHLLKPHAVPKACCAPTKLSATSVLYYDSSNNVILRKHRNMVVRACGCPILSQPSPVTITHQPDPTWSRVFEDKVFIVKLLPVDGLAAGAVVVGEITARAHELGDDAVEAAA
ncbi:PREDICTED: bone morphogenetic protein 8A [Bison bison bison]|uniref:Bone morphogenetic protein 8A n=1 Tax=Bison bison bison TaxID=43346 RepID=A0A6P3J3I8_BISBB|nr:PREDICTED: bone morphogenetic protein 8A [Bison bison bison]